MVSGGEGECTNLISSNYAKVEAFLGFINTSKKDNSTSNSPLTKEYIKNLGKGWYLLGTEKIIDSNTKIFTNDISKIYIYGSTSRKWTRFDINNETPPSNLYIPANSGFWTYKP